MALRGLGDLTVDGGSISNTGSRGLDIDTVSGGSLTLNQEVQTDSGSITLSPAGTLYLAHSGTSAISQTSASLTIASPVVLKANTTIDQGTGSSSNTILFGSTIDSLSATNVYDLTVTAALDNVTFGGAIGASFALGTLKATSASAIKAANVGPSGSSPAAGAGTLSVKAESTGSVEFTGGYYSTSGSQSWAALTSTTPASLTADSAATWLTPAILSLQGNFISTNGNATLKSGDIDLGVCGTWNLSGRALNFFTFSGAKPMNIGFDDGLNDAWTISDKELPAAGRLGRGPRESRLRGKPHAKRRDHLRDGGFLRGQRRHRRGDDGQLGLKRGNRRLRHQPRFALRVTPWQCLEPRREYPGGPRLRRDPRGLGRWPD